jgi:mannose-1-phosphate guanylyltransferase/mannose-6-phosphate isomerase
MTPAIADVIRPVILCGGAGTRLWPLSTQQRPKQFLQLIGDKTLLQQTAARLSGERFGPALIVSSSEQGPLVEKQLADANAAPAAILLEPIGRNTAAAAALAATWSSSNEADELLLLMPSDHVIGDREAFVRAIDVAVPHALGGAIVTFGAQPTEPNTQYGYIEAAEELGDGAFRIARFHEKPNAARAAEYLATGRFYWNCGIFLAKASTIIEEMRRHLRSSLDLITASLAQAVVDGRVVRPSAASFCQAENISIDNAIMEKTDRGVVVPVQMEWSDVGAWDAVWKLGDKDAEGNVTHGDVVTLDTRNSLLRSDGQAIIAAIGLQNIAVIATDDGILVAPLDRVSEVKELLVRLQNEKSGRQ